MFQSNPLFLLPWVEGTNNPVDARLAGDQSWELERFRRTLSVSPSLGGWCHRSHHGVPQFSEAFKFIIIVLKFSEVFKFLIIVLTTFFVVPFQKITLQSGQVHKPAYWCMSKKAHFDLFLIHFHACSCWCISSLVWSLQNSSGSFPKNKEWSQQWSPAFCCGKIQFGTA